MPRGKIIIFSSAVLLTLFPMVVHGAGVVMNEVLFNPVGNDTGAEWIELYNSSDTAQNLDGWELYPDGAGYFYFPSGFTLKSKNYVVIHLRSSGTTTDNDLYYSGTSTSTNMGNSAGSAALFSGEPRGKDTMRSFVQWGGSGKTWESDAAKAGLWIKGTYVDIAGLNRGDSIGLISDGMGVGNTAWKISSTTPGISNTLQPASLLVASPTSDATTRTTDTHSVSVLEKTQGNFTVPVVPLPIPKIKVYAGEDQIAVNGSAIEFVGNAFGLKDEPLPQARFWWNFGDGETEEGRAITHVFKIPGEYIVGLHVSSGEYTASDYLTTTVIPNQVTIKNVVAGAAGFITLINPSPTNVDIGGWIIEDAEKKQFFLPVKTEIGARSEISLPNNTTSLAQASTTFPLVLRYPTSEIIVTWDHQDKNTPRTIVPEITPASPVQEKNQTLKHEADSHNDFYQVSQNVLSENSSTTTIPHESVASTTDFSGVAISHFFSGTSFLTLAALLSLIAAAGFLVIKTYI